MWLQLAGLPHEAFDYLNNIVDQNNDDSIELSPETNGRVQLDGTGPVYNVWYRTEVHR
jgi:hypothetical protein